RESLPAAAELLRDLLDLGAGGHEHRHATSLAQYPLHEAVVEELEGLLRQHAHAGGLGGVERPGFEHLHRAEVAGVKRRVDRRRQPHEAAGGALSQRQAQLQFRGGLMDLVHHEGVACRDQAVLEPAARDPGGDDHDVPGRRLGRRLALAVHYADLERRAQHGGGDRPDGERLARARRRDDAEAASRSRKAANIVAVLAAEQRVDLEAHRQLDRLARGPCRGDHDDAPGRWFGGEEGGGIGGKEVIARRAHGRNIERRGTKSGRHARLPLSMARPTPVASVTRRRPGDVDDGSAPRRRAARTAAAAGAGRSRDAARRRRRGDSTRTAGPRRRSRAPTAAARRTRPPRSRASAPLPAWRRAPAPTRSPRSCVSYVTSLAPASTWKGRATARPAGLTAAASDSWGLQCGRVAGRRHVTYRGQLPSPTLTAPAARPAASGAALL